MSSPTFSGVGLPLMHLVQVTSPSEVLRSLRDVAGLRVVEASVSEVGAGSWSVSAYATDDAIADVRNRGGHVHVMLDAQARIAHLERVAEEARRSNPPDSEQ